MSGGACTVIIGDGEKLKALAQQAVNIWTLEMQGNSAYPKPARAQYVKALQKAIAIMESANDELAAQDMGPAGAESAHE